MTLLIVKKEDFRSSLEERISIGQQIFNSEIENIDELDELETRFNDWDDYNLELIKQSFNNPKSEYFEAYKRCASGVGIMRVMNRIPETSTVRVKEFNERVESKLSNLTKLVAKIDLLKSDVNAEDRKSSNSKSNDMDTNNVFIVHGHNDTIKHEMARTVEKLGLTPIILHEQANKGRTVIEKFVGHSDVGFAIILLTGDDYGRAVIEEKDQLRARQNVIIEMGFFIGKLGRDRVFPLYESGVELPSDLNGVVYTPLDEKGKWKFDLVKELKAAGYEVDANQLI